MIRFPKLRSGPAFPPPPPRRPRNGVSVKLQGTISSGGLAGPGLPEV